MKGRVDAIVLAAGASQRMGEGRQKLLMDVAGHPMIRRVVEAVSQCDVGEILVITGSHHSAISKILSDIDRLRILQNPDPARGMLSSIRCGLEALNAPTRGVALLLGDQPEIQTATINTVIASWQASPLDLAVPIHHGKRGHPLIFDLRFREAVMTRYDNVGLRGLVQAETEAERVLEVPVNEQAVLNDIDTPVDLARTLDTFKKSSGS